MRQAGRGLAANACLPALRPKPGPPPQLQGGTPAAAALPRAAAALCRIALIATAASTALGVGRMASIEDRAAGAADRAYRLHYNAGQRRTDLFAHAGGLLGGSAAAAFLPASAAVVVGGAAAGTAAGVLAHLVTMPRSE